MLQYSIKLTITVQIKQTVMVLEHLQYYHVCYY